MKQVIISSTLLDFEDTVVKLKVRDIDDSLTLVKFAVRFASNELGHSSPLIGHPCDTDDENDGCVVDHGDEGVYFFFDDWVHYFQLLDKITKTEG
jgi:hypothetical protein